MSVPLIGSELFINRGDRPEQVRAWVEQMADAGFKLIRLFALWDLIEPRPGRWDFDCFDAAFDAAETHGLGVVPTAFSACPPGWMRLSIASQQVVDPNHPQVAGPGEAYLRRLVERYRDHPALHSWIVWNEAGLAMRPEPSMREPFQRFLESVYGPIENLNDRYYGQHERYDQVDLPAMDQDAHVPIPSHLQRIDWWRFCTHYVTAAVARYTGIIRELDPDHAVHLNPHRLGHCMFHEGQSVWKIADVVDFVGCSAHPVWHSTRFGPQRAAQSIGLFSAMCRGASRAGRRFWVSELQGGPAAFSGFEPGCPSPSELRQWVWEGIGRGAEAVVFWTFNGRRDGGEVGEWMLLDQRGEPSPRLHAVSRCIDEVKSLSPLLSKAKPPRAGAAVLWSEASLMHGYAYGNGEDQADPRNRQRNADAVCGAFALLDDLHIEADVIDEDRLATDEDLERYPLIVLPDCWSLTAATIDRLVAYVKAGGWVVADGLPGYLDARTRLHEGKRSALQALFGSALVDYLPTPNEVELPGGSGAFGWLNRVVLNAVEAEAVLQWPDGGAAVTRRRDEAGGGAVWVGTHLFQRYFAKPDEAARQWLEGFLPASAWPAVRWASGTSVSLRLRQLEHPDGRVVVVMNTSGDMHSGTLETPEGWRLRWADSDAQAGDAVPMHLTLKPGEVRVMQAWAGAAGAPSQQPVRGKPVAATR